MAHDRGPGRLWGRDASSAVQMESAPGGLVRRLRLSTRRWRAPHGAAGGPWACAPPSSPAAGDLQASLKAVIYSGFITGASSQLFDLAEADNDFAWIDYLLALSACPPTHGRAAVAYTLGTCTARTPSSTSCRVLRRLRGLANYISDSARRMTLRRAEILADGDGSVAGVRLASGDEVLCPTVVSNADAWTTATKLVKPRAAAHRDWLVPRRSCRRGRSFTVVGFDAAGLPLDLIAIIGLQRGLLEYYRGLDAERIWLSRSRRCSTPGSRRRKAFYTFTRPRRNRTRGPADRRAQNKAKKLAAAEPLWRALGAVPTCARRDDDHRHAAHARGSTIGIRAHTPAGATVEGDPKAGDGGTPVKGPGRSATRSSRIGSSLRRRGHPANALVKPSTARCSATCGRRGFLRQGLVAERECGAARAGRAYCGRCVAGGGWVFCVSFLSNLLSALCATSSVLY